MAYTKDIRDTPCDSLAVASLRSARPARQFEPRRVLPLTATHLARWLHDAFVLLQLREKQAKVRQRKASLPLAKASMVMAPIAAIAFCGYLQALRDFHEFPSGAYEGASVVQRAIQPPPGHGVHGYSAHRGHSVHVAKLYRRAGAGMLALPLCLAWRHPRK